MPRQHQCGHCEYSTDRLNNLTHDIEINIRVEEAEREPQKIMDVLASRASRGPKYCGKCDRPEFSSKIYARKHEEPCAGLMPEQCGVCSVTGAPR